MIIADTPSAILAYRLLAMKSALKLETLGLSSSRGSVSNDVRYLCGSRTRDKKKLLAEFENHLKHQGILKS
jgi:hypothetical protein